MKRASRASGSNLSTACEIRKRCSVHAEPTQQVELAFPGHFGSAPPYLSQSTIALGRSRDSPTCAKIGQRCQGDWAARSDPSCMGRFSLGWEF